MEAICTQGCDSVRKVIADLESGRVSAVDFQLDTSCTSELLAELKSVMAVYDARQQPSEENTRFHSGASHAQSN